MIFPLPFGEPALTDLADHRAEDRIAAHQQPPGAPVVVGSQRLCGHLRRATGYLIATVSVTCARISISPGSTGVDTC